MKKKYFVSLFILLLLFLSISYIKDQKFIHNKFYRSITKLNSVWKVCRECNTKLGAAGDMTKRQPYKERFELFQRLVSWTVGVQGQLPIITKY